MDRSCSCSSVLSGPPSHRGRRLSGCFSRCVLLVLATDERVNSPARRSSSNTLPLIDWPSELSNSSTFNQTVFFFLFERGPALCPDLWLVVTVGSFECLAKAQTLRVTGWTQMSLCSNIVFSRNDWQEKRWKHNLWAYDGNRDGSGLCNLSLSVLNVTVTFCTPKERCVSSVEPLLGY